MMKFMRGVVFAVLTVGVGTGCGSKIFHATFDTGSGSPHGSVPGNPADDFISAPGNSQYPNIGSQSLQFVHPSGGRIFLSSAEVKKADSTRTLFWSGNRVNPSHNVPFIVDISALNGIGIGPWPNIPLTVKVWPSKIELRGPNDEPLESDEVVTDGEHTVFISLRLADNTYRGSIKQPNQDEIPWSGVIPAATADLIKSRSRMHVRVGFPATGGTPNTIYRMDDIIMREK